MKFYRFTINQLIPTIFEDKFRGETQLKISIEEMAEFTQQITKLMRGKYDVVHFLEEFVDVCFCLGCIKEILAIRDEDIYAAVTVKYNKLENILLENGKCS